MIYTKEEFNKKFDIKDDNWALKDNVKIEFDTSSNVEIIVNEVYDMAGIRLGTIREEDIK